MRKLQQFYTLKFSSDRLRKSKYNVTIPLDNARINNEVITINNSELLRALFRYKKVDFSQKELDILFNVQKKLKKAENTPENRSKLEQTTQRIEKILFVEDLVSVEFKHKAHYLAIIKRHGFYVNGIRFVPFMASSGMIRKNTALFINNNIRHPLMDILENGRNESAPMVAAKFGAYFSLYCTSSLDVSFPRFAVIPDKKIDTLRRVDLVEYVGEDEDDSVTELEQTLSMSAWDGQGLISPEAAARWSKELDLDYTFSAAIVRAPFLKGLLVTFDFIRFATDVIGSYEFTDIYGQKQDAREFDLIISESMFKLWFAYESTNSYIENCNKNKLGFSIAKVNPKKDSACSRTSYQFLQVLNLTSVDIGHLCEPTINWFRDISGGSAEQMLLYATGEYAIDPRDFKKLDITTKALLLNPELARDRYIQQRFIHTIAKKKKESYMGSVLMNANYQFMISDPYYQACHMYGSNKPPLLNDGEHYSAYWLKRGIKTVGAIRSPIVHHSEFNVLNLKDTKDTRSWYEHINSGIIFPASGIGIDCAIHGGADFDGDLVCTFNNPVMIKGKIAGLPIVYNSRTINKTVVDSRDDAEQVNSQLHGHNSKVGFATNISSSMYAMLKEFPVGSKEHQTLLTRLKIGRVIQGEIIDGVKGLSVPPFRNHWTRHKKITPEMSPEEVEKWQFYNSILCGVRPSFFRFLYPHYMTRYNKELKNYDIYSRIQFGKPFDEIVTSQKRSADEEQLIQDYKSTTFFLDNDSTVNTITRFMRTSLALVEKYAVKESRDSNHLVLLSSAFTRDEYKISQMMLCLKEYKAFKRGVHKELSKSQESLDGFIAYLRKKCFSEISSNEAELANYAILVTYEKEVGMVEFPWRMFPQGILQNMLENAPSTVKFPIQDDSGEISYLWNTYSLKEFQLEELYEN